MCLVISFLLGFLMHYAFMLTPRSQSGSSVSHTCRQWGGADEEATWPILCRIEHLEPGK
jgi:hypothetical protein